MRADRVVATLLLMQTRGRVTAAELADELEVSVATARRDLEALQTSGFPLFDELIDGTLSGESFDTTSLDVLRGVQESIVLFGEERYEPIRARVLDYPDSLRQAVVEANLKVTPSWIYDGMGRERGDLVVLARIVAAVESSSQPGGEYTPIPPVFGPRLPSNTAL